MTQVQKLHLEQDRRILVTSDIHGGLDVFVKLLKKVNYSENDYLFILGDLIERGPQSLETVRYVMRLVEKGNVFVVKGNNDTIMEDIDNLSLTYNDYVWLKKRGNTIVFEMGEENGILISKETDFESIIKLFKDKYQKEINFIKNLPHIIETDRFLFVHAGIDDFNDLENNDCRRLMRMNRYLDFAGVSPKLLFVGHYPSLGYSISTADYGPKRNFKKRIIAIDGAFQLKEEGQLNLIIIDCEKNINIDYVYADNLKECKVKEIQEGNENYELLLWDMQDIEIIFKDDLFSFCRVTKKNNELFEIKIPNYFLYNIDGKWYSADYTNHFLDLEKGEIVKYVFKIGEWAFIKKGQIAGWTMYDNLIFKDE